MDRSNPYEAAFEAYLNAHGLCYIGVDEKKRSFLDEAPVKNLDFVVLGAGGTRLLVDVKGRRFPGGPPERQRRVWENWSTQEDIRGLTSWMRLFGPGYLGLFVFMYKIGAKEILADETGPWTWHGTRYRLLAVPVEEYSRHMRVRSPRWGTVSLQGSVFRSLARPFGDFSLDPERESERDSGPLFEEPYSHESDQDRHLCEFPGPLAETGPAPGPETWGERY
jgi:hypothetical protein